MTSSSNISTLSNELGNLSPNDRLARLQELFTKVRAACEQENRSLHQRVIDVELALKRSEMCSNKLKEDNGDLTLKCQKQESLLQAYEKEFKKLWEKNEKLKEENEDLEAEIEEREKNRSAVYDVEEMGRGAGRSLW